MTQEEGVYIDVVQCEGVFSPPSRSLNAIADLLDQLDDLFTSFGPAGAEEHISEVPLPLRRAEPLRGTQRLAMMRWACQRRAIP